MAAKAKTSTKTINKKDPNVDVTTRLKQSKKKRESVRELEKTPPGDRVRRSLVEGSTSKPIK